MKMLNTLFTLSGLLLLSAGAQAACEYPSKVPVPNGSEASQEEMVAGQKAVKSYMNSMNTYLDCIEAEAKSAASADEAPEITEQRNTLMTKRYNAAVTEMETLAAEFNVQVRAYKARSE
ncbi:MAG: hypothetical protein AAGJ86_00130 [Pseudomonadota bacterium]